MKKQRTFRSALPASIGEALPAYPLVLVFSVYVSESSPYLLWCAVALSLLAGIIAGKRLRRERAYLIASAAAILLTAASAAAQPFGSAGQAFCVLALLALAGLRGVHTELRIPPSRRTETLSASVWLAAGLIVYRLSGGVPALGVYTFSVYLSCALTLALMMIRWNTHRVRESQGLSATEEMPANRLLYANRGFTVALLLLILAAGLMFPSSNPFGGKPRSQEPQNLPVFSQRPAQPNDQAAECIVLYEKAEVRAEKEGRSVSMDELPPQCQTASAASGNEADDGKYGWVDLLVAFGIAAAILAAAYYALRILYFVLAEWLPDWLKRLLSNLRIASDSGRRGEAEAYRDTTERLRTRRSKTARRAPASFAEPAEGPRRDYFRLVREAVRRGYVFRPWMTPSETGREIASKPAYRELDEPQVEELVERYNRIRYQERPDRDGEF